MKNIILYIDLQNYEGDESEEGGSAAGGRDNVYGSIEASTEGKISTLDNTNSICIIDDVFVETNNEEENTNGGKNEDTNGGNAAEEVSDALQGM